MIDNTTERLIEEQTTISDNVDRGIAELREQQGSRRFEVERDGEFGLPPTPKLEDVDGVGPATADKLRDAGVDHPEELSRLTPSMIEKVDGIGPRRADSLAAKFQYRQDIRFDNDSADPEDVREAHADRSPEARRADRSFNAEITLNEDKWLSDPNKYDFPGVDTIPEQRRAERTRKAAQAAGVSRIQMSDLGGAQGVQSGGVVEVDSTQAWDPVSTVAHEVGHAIEPERGFAESEIFGDSEELRDQAATLSSRRRFGDFDGPSDVRDRIQQDEDSELFADAVAGAIEEPRAARREAPELLSKIEREFGGTLPGRRS